MLLFKIEVKTFVICQLSRTKNSREQMTFMCTNLTMAFCRDYMVWITVCVCA